jgi:hypothetical protein
MPTHIDNMLNYMKRAVGVKGRWLQVLSGKVTYEHLLNLRPAPKVIRQFCGVLDRRDFKATLRKEDREIASSRTNLDHGSSWANVAFDDPRTAHSDSDA